MSRFGVGASLHGCSPTGTANLSSQLHSGDGILFAAKNAAKAAQEG
jgi:hypothetical protein